MTTIKRFARQAGFSSTVAGLLAFCRKKSTRFNYQARWGTYRKWCMEFGHRSSFPSISKIAEFLTYLFKRKGAALSTIKGYRAMLSAVFKFPLPGIFTSPVLKTSFGLLRYLLPGPFSLLRLGIWIRFWSICQVRRLSPLRKNHFWTKPRRPCSFWPWLRRSLPPILCLVLSLFRLFRTLLVICPRVSSALSERLSSSGKLLDQPPIFRPGFSSLLGIRNVPCR